MTLTHLVLVRIQAGQPFDAFSLRSSLLMACGRQTDAENQMISAAWRMAPSLSRGTPVVYFLRLRSGIVYVGCSTDFTQRLSAHLIGHACRTTTIDPPTAVLRIEMLATFSAARLREAQLKRWSRAKKEALVRGDELELRKLSRSREQFRSGGNATKPPPVG